MPKYTLLDMVQNILSDMEADEVNSIGDTVESAQVASIIKDTYYDLLSNRLWPTNAQVVGLTASGTTARPTHFTLPANVVKVNWIRYNTKDSGGKEEYTTLSYLEPEDFLALVHARSTDESNVLKVVDGNAQYFIINDKDPEYYTSFDDETIIVDSYDKTVDSTLQSSKCMASVYIEPAWQNVDSFVPDMPLKAFSLLLSEAKSSAFIKLKQVTEQMEVARARRQRTFLANEKWQTKKGTTRYPNYGRK